MSTLELQNVRVTNVQTLEAVFRGNTGTTYSVGFGVVILQIDLFVVSVSFRTDPCSSFCWVPLHVRSVSYLQPLGPK